MLPSESDAIDVNLRLPRRLLRTLILRTAADDDAGDHRIALAGYLVSSRARRQAALGDIRMTEPLLAILLDLYVAHQRGEPVAVSALSASSGAPFSSGLRYIDKLVSKGLAMRTTDPADKRRALIALSEPMLARIERWLDTEFQHLCSALLPFLVAAPARAKADRAPRADQARTAATR